MPCQRERQFFCLGLVKNQPVPDQQRRRNGQIICHEKNVAGPSAIGLHGASKLRRYTSTTLHEYKFVLAGYVGSVVVRLLL